MAQGVAMTTREVEDWLRGRGVAEGVIRDEAGYIADKYADSDEDPEAVLNSSIGGYMQRTNSGGDRSNGGYSTDEDDPAWGNAPARSDSGRSSGGGGSGGGGGGSIFDAWNSAFTDRANDLYSTFSNRANQGLTVDRNDPIIRAQADAFSANQERSKRNYLSDTAEREGPLANIQGERRMAAEHYGAATGEFEAELMARELTARRTEIAQALQSMAGLLTGEQTRELQWQIAQLDAELQRIGMDNQVSMASMTNDYNLRDLGMRDTYQSMYYDLLQRGVLG